MTVDVYEHERTLPPIEAVDPDSDRLTFSISGPDREFFVVDESTGEVSVAEQHELDHETRTDYEFILQVKDPGGRPDRITVTVNVLDVPEPPGQPNPPSAIASSETTAAVFWLSPEDTGDSPIRDFDLRYRIAGTDDWSTHTTGALLTTALLTDLVPDATYELQLRAYNDAGPGPWSNLAYVTLPEPVAPPPAVVEPGEDDLDASDELVEEESVEPPTDAEEPSAVETPPQDEDDESAAITPDDLPWSGSGGLFGSTTAADHRAWTWAGLTLLGLGLTALLLLGRYSWLRR